MGQPEVWGVWVQPISRWKRARQRLLRHIMRMVFLPGDSLSDGAKRICIFVLGWGGLIALFAWGGYTQGSLHGVGDGVTFCAVLFVLALLAAPGYRRPPGPPIRHG